MRSVRLKILFLMLSCTVQLHINSCNSQDDNFKSRAGSNQVDQLLQQAKAFLKNDNDSALIVAETAKQLSLKENYIAGQQDALVIIGDFYQQKGNFTKSVDYYLKAIDLSGTKKNKQQAVALLGLARLYKDMSGDITKNYTNIGIGYSKQTYNIYLILNDTNEIANSLSMQGILYRDKAKTYNRNYYDTT